MTDESQISRFQCELNWRTEPDEDTLFRMLGTETASAISSLIRNIFERCPVSQPVTIRFTIPEGENWVHEYPGRPRLFLKLFRTELSSVLEGANKGHVSSDGIDCEITATERVCTDDHVSGTIDQGSIQTALPLYETIVGDPSPEKSSELDELLVVIDSKARARLAENQRQIVEELTAALRGTAHVSHRSYSNINKLLRQHRLGIESGGVVHETFNESFLGNELRFIPLGQERQTERDELINKLQEDIRGLEARILSIGNSTLGTQESQNLAQSLPDQQRAVLQAILELPEGAFSEASKLMEPLVGQPMTQAFCNSFKAVMRQKSWGVVCSTCERPSVLVWIANPKYSEGGFAAFSHASPGPHGGLVTVCNFLFRKKLDKRKKSV